jgi:uncharacterized membrane protein YjgN (DUF898 family)
MAIAIEMELQAIEPRDAPAATPAPSMSTAGPAHTRAAQDTNDDGLYPFRFTGTGSEYFRIWVVNLLLSIVTLGAYSAWAKVRRMRYFYRNTRLDGSIFDYHGKPAAIFKGRLLALLLVGAYKLAIDLSQPVGLAIAALLVAITPWLLARSFRFQLGNSSYRGLRFRFAGSVGGAYRALSVLPLLLALITFAAWSAFTSMMSNPRMNGMAWLTLALLPLLAAAIPWSHFRLKRYQLENAYYGHTPVFFHARGMDFFKIYGRAIGFLMLGSVSGGVFGFLTRRLFFVLQASMFGWLFTLLYGVLVSYAFYLFVRPFIESRIQNLVWNQTELGGNRFISHASARSLFWIHASNLLFITLSLGLYKPFAVIRLLKYRVESMTLLPDGDLEQFMADHAGENNDTLGQEVANLFDIDISL